MSEPVSPSVQQQASASSHDTHNTHNTRDTHAQMSAYICTRCARRFIYSSKDCDKDEEFDCTRCSKLGLPCQPLPHEFRPRMEDIIRRSRDIDRCAAAEINQEVEEETLQDDFDELFYDISLHERSQKSTLTDSQDREVLHSYLGRIAVALEGMLHVQQSMVNLNPWNTSQNSNAAEARNIPLSADFRHEHNDLDKQSSFDDLSNSENLHARRESRRTARKNGSTLFVNSVTTAEDDEEGDQFDDQFDNIFDNEVDDEHNANGIIDSPTTSIHQPASNSKPRSQRGVNIEDDSSPAPPTQPAFDGGASVTSVPETVLEEDASSTPINTHRSGEAIGGKSTQTKRRVTPEKLAEMKKKVKLSLETRSVSKAKQTSEQSEKVEKKVEKTNEQDGEKKVEKKADPASKGTATKKLTGTKKEEEQMVEKKVATPKKGIATKKETAAKKEAGAKKETAAKKVKNAKKVSADNISASSRDSEAEADGATGLQNRGKSEASRRFMAVIGAKQKGAGTGSGSGSKGRRKHALSSDSEVDGSSETPKKRQKK